MTHIFNKKKYQKIIILIITDCFNGSSLFRLNSAEFHTLAASAVATAAGQGPTERSLVVKDQVSQSQRLSVATNSN